MSIEDLPREGLTPSQLWSALDEPTRRLAALALYRDKESRREGDAAIAAALRFRDVAVRKLPAEQRVAHLLQSVRPDDTLASSLLIALHLNHRRPLLAAFLGELGIPHEDGLIDASYELEPPDAERLAGPVETLYGQFDAAEVDLYLISLLAMDEEAWTGLAGLVRCGRSQASR